MKEKKDTNESLFSDCEATWEAVQAKWKPEEQQKPPRVRELRCSVHPGFTQVRMLLLLLNVLISALEGKQKQKIYTVICR